MHTLRRCSFFFLNKFLVPYFVGLEVKHHPRGTAGIFYEFNKFSTFAQAFPTSINTED